MTAPSFNPLVASRYAELLRRWIGEDLRIDSVAPELVPVIVLEDDPDELALLKQERLWIDLTNLAAGGAGVFSGIVILNPANSGMIVRVELLLSTQDGINTGLGNQALAAINAGFVFSRNPILSDQRLTPKTQNAALGTTQILQKIAGAFVGGPVNTGRIPVNTPFATKYVLAPGTFLQIEQLTGNTAWSLTTIGRERSARPEELVLNP